MVNQLNSQQTSQFLYLANFFFFFSPSGNRCLLVQSNNYCFYEFCFKMVLFQWFCLLFQRPTDNKAKLLLVATKLILTSSKSGITHSSSELFKDVSFISFMTDLINSACIINIPTTVTGLFSLLEKEKPMLVVDMRCNTKIIKHSQVIFAMLYTLLLNIIFSIALILCLNSNATPSRECHIPLRKGEQ